MASEEIGEQPSSATVPDTNFTGTTGYANAAELVRISAALIAAMSEARAMVERGNFGPDFADLVQHARELHELIGEELATAGAGVAEYAVGLYVAMATN